MHVRLARTLTAVLNGQLALRTVGLRPALPLIVMILTGCAGTPPSVLPSSGSDGLSSSPAATFPAWRVTALAGQGVASSLMETLSTMSRPSGGVPMVIDYIRHAGDWAIAIATPDVPEPAGEGEFLLAWRVGDGTWKVASGSETIPFCAAVTAAGSFLTEAEVAYFQGCQ
jgi:hypothetical protein